MKRPYLKTHIKVSAKKNRKLYMRWYTRLWNAEHPGYHAAVERKARKEGKR